MRKNREEKLKIQKTIMSMIGIRSDGPVYARNTNGSIWHEDIRAIRFYVLAVKQAMLCLLIYQYCRKPYFLRSGPK